MPLGWLEQHVEAQHLIHRPIPLVQFQDAPHGLNAGAVHHQHLLPGLNSTWRLSVRHSGRFRSSSPKLNDFTRKPSALPCHTAPGDLLNTGECAASLHLRATAPWCSALEFQQDDLESNQCGSAGRPSKHQVRRFRAAARLNQFSPSRGRSSGQCRRS